jgi:hypothetical protein
MCLQAACATETHMTDGLAFMWWRTPKVEFPDNLVYQFAFKETNDTYSIKESSSGLECWKIQSN